MSVAANAMTPRGFTPTCSSASHKLALGQDVAARAVDVQATPPKVEVVLLSFYKSQKKMAGNVNSFFSINIQHINGSIKGMRRIKISMTCRYAVMFKLQHILILFSL
ncbi:hypothetical protein BS78_01G220900 [Paspalum vaginatum]|nr:hypothetical protein BS78_01G220900 [Paspalum vaginatum]